MKHPDQHTVDRSNMQQKLNEDDKSIMQSVITIAPLIGVNMIWVLLVGFFFWRLSYLSEFDEKVKSAAFERCADQGGVAFVSGSGDRILCADKNVILFETSAP